MCVLYLRYGRYVKLLGGKRGSVIDKPTVTRYSLSLSWLGLAWLGFVDYYYYLLCYYDGLTLFLRLVLPF